MADLQDLVSSLVKENQRLRRQLARLQEAGSGPDLRGLKALIRRTERALSPKTRSKPASRTQSARKPASPEVLAKRREALARARQVRAERRAAPDTGTG